MTYRLSALAACLFLLCGQPAPGGLFTFREDGLAFIGFEGEQAGTSGELVKGGDPLNPDLTGQVKNFFRRGRVNHLFIFSGT